MTQNNLQKKLIDALITTHQEPAKAFKKAIRETQTQQEHEQLQRIAAAFKIDIDK